MNHSLAKNLDPITTYSYKLPDKKFHSTAEIQQEWDKHGSYQWTYFNEKIKELINFFLSKKVGGKNLDLGGGWYLYSPNSTVVDISPVNLDYNPAKEKVVFDLNDIGKGKNLPFPDNSFHSATMISVWQYLHYPKKVLEELERVLIPGGELYIINGQGAGVLELVCGASSSQKIEKEIQSYGYDTIRENIPIFHGNPTDFQSVCVSMPEQTLFGAVSEIKNKTAKILANQKITDNQNIFLDEFIETQMSQAEQCFHKLETYPITKFSRDYLERMQELDDLCFEKTKKHLIAYGENPSICLNLSLDKKDFFSTILYPEGKIETEILDGFTKNLDLFILRTVSSLGKNIDMTLQQKKCDDYNINEYIDFLCSIPLNQYTKDLQLELFTLLKTIIPNLDDKIKYKKARQLYYLFSNHKQRNTITKLIETKNKIHQKNIPIVGEAKLDYIDYLPYFKEFGSR